MASILEAVKSGANFNSYDVLESELTHVISRLYDSMLLEQDEQKKLIIKSIRDDIVFIRGAVNNLNPKLQ